MKRVMKEPSRVLIFLASVAALIVLNGCGNSGYTSVSGVVTLDDAPLADANVVFHAPGRPVATARTDQSGRFSVETGGARGMRPGEYIVTVAAYEQPKVKGGPKSPKLIIPEKYVKPDSSGLSAEIKEGSKTDLTFVLTKS